MYYKPLSSGQIVFCDTISRWEKQFRMSKETFFICECGSTVLAISHNWTEQPRYEQIGQADDEGHYSLDEPLQVEHETMDEEWVAYCGGCGKGITVEWISDRRVRLLLDNKAGKS
jgi:hypothetical protein